MQDIALYSARPITRELLWEWADAGWLRRLDAALATWAAEHDRQANSTLLACIALLSHMEGKGHTCLTLQDGTDKSLHQQLPALLRWPAEAAPALQALQHHLASSIQAWLGALQASRLVWFAASTPATTDDINTNTDHGQPFILARNGKTLRLYLRRYWQYEQTVAHHILARASHHIPVEPAKVRQWLDCLFPQTEPDAPFNWQKAACAIALRSHIGIITGGPGTGKTYTAARLLAAALALQSDPTQMRIGLAAPTGKAAARLKESIQQAMQQLPAAVQAQPALQQALQSLPPARTLHALLGARPDSRQMRYNASNPLPLDWLIVDEASMIHLEMMHNLLEALPATAQLILLGDKDQLASVEAGAVLGDFCANAEQGNYNQSTADYLQQTMGEQPPAEYIHAETTSAPLPQSTVMLRQSRRFGGVIGKLAQAVNQANFSEMRQLLVTSAVADSPVFWSESASPSQSINIAFGKAEYSGVSASYADLVVALRQPLTWPQTIPDAGSLAWGQWQQQHSAWVQSVLNALDRFRILCATREGEWGVSGINTSIIGQLRQEGIAARHDGWFTGRVIQVTQNSPELGVFNGDVGICLPSAQNRSALRAFFPIGSDNTDDHAALRSVAITRLAHVETAFAMTVHKSQGSEFEHVLLALPPQAGMLLNKELVYTGLTRARQKFTYLAPQPGVWEQAVRQKTLRSSGLAALLQMAQR